VAAGACAQVIVIPNWRSVRFQLPAFLLVVGIAVFALSLAVALQRTVSTGLESREQAARSSLSAIARMLADLQYRQDDEGVREAVAQMGAMSDLDGAVFVDAAGVVRASTHKDAIGMPLDSLEWVGAPGRIARARELDHSVTEHDAQGFTQVAIPVRMGTLDRLGEVSHQGVLLARLDLRPLVRTLRRETVRFFGLMALASLFGLLTVALFLHYRVARPALSIARAAERSAAGDRSARTGLAGGDELARAGMAFDEMAAHVAETEDMLRRQQGLLDGLLATLPVGVFVVERASQTVIYANPRVQELSGYAVPVGQSLSTLGGRRENAKGDPIPLASLPIERVLVEGRAVENDDLVYVHPNGLRVPVITTAHPMNLGGGPDFDAVLAVVQDRRDIERAFAELKASEERFQNASLATGQAVYEWDMVRDQCRFSDSITSIFGYEASEVDSNAKWSRINHPEDLQVVKKEMAACMRDRRVFDAVHRVKHKDGRWRWVRDRGVLHFDEAGRAVHMIGAVADVTDQHELEARLLQAQKMETVGTLAGGVAHDFNNQLTGVLGHLDLLSEDLPEDDARQEHVRVARRAAQRCAELTRGLLAFSRMLRSEARAVDVNLVMDEAATLLRRVLPATIHLELAPGESLPPAHVDPTQLQQVVLNLCVNARDAMPSGGTLHLSSDVVRVPEGGERAATAPAGDYVRITVRDEGAGIAPEVLPRIFEPFFTTKPVGEGTGLGLSMVYGIVSQHRGWVDVDSPPGRGATFRVQLPVVTSDEAPASIAAVTPRPARYAPRTVMVVDDEAIVRDFAARLLERAGCQVLRAGDGAEALSLLAPRAADVESVLLDLTMPGMPVQEVVSRMRRMAPGARIVLTSGYAQDMGAQAEFAGLAFLAKPYSPDDMLSLMCAPAPGANAPGA
jgi:PAS domain S-box-containing protein